MPIQSCKNNPRLDCYEFLFKILALWVVDNEKSLFKNLMIFKFCFLFYKIDYELKKSCMKSYRSFLFDNSRSAAGTLKLLTVALTKGDLFTRNGPQKSLVDVFNYIK